MAIIKLLFCYLFVSVGISMIFAVTNDQDAKVMLALKEKWSNTPQSWGTSDDPCGTQWDGITCDDNNRIIKLNLTNSGLTGTFPDDISNLTELEILDLSVNRGLTGPIPPSLGNLSKLLGFSFEACSITGSIPSELGNAAQLSAIILRGNNLTGEIPSSIGKLSNLELLDLAENQLTGSIPISSAGTLGLDQLKKLEVLDVLNNNFTGQIPDLSGLVNLTVVNLGNNSFESSEAPTWISSLQYLSYLDLGRASLYGPVPNGIFSLPELIEVNLSNNDFNGTLDMSYIKSNNLTFVDFENNKISDLKLSPNFNNTLLLAGNSYCEQSANANQAICQPRKLPVD